MTGEMNDVVDVLTATMYSRRNSDDLIGLSNAHIETYQIRARIESSELDKRSRPAEKNLRSFLEESVCQSQRKNRRRTGHETLLFNSSSYARSY
jgi:hypothetical protein